MLERIKELLQQEIVQLYTKDEAGDLVPYKTEIDFIPILRNDNEIILQFNGWSINLYSDGTYIWEATDGG